METACGLYIHVPFCGRKCRYCDFYSREPREGERDRFVRAVVREMELRGSGRAVDTVYFGGGTPSLLGHERLARLLNAAREHFAVARGAEITVEANPLGVTGDWAAACVRAGFNRISVGVQSLDDGDLRFLGRMHSAEDGPRAVATARTAGFGEVGIDVIYGLPDQRARDVKELVVAAVGECAPDHVSCYQLTYAEGTPLWRDLADGRVKRLGEEQERELFFCVHETLAELGYPAYEVSNFSRGDAHRSRHNSKYWRHEPYVGVGPAAHSFDPPVRSWNVRSISGYLSALEGGGSAGGGSERLSEQQLAAEMVMLALRTTDGLDLGLYRERFGDRVAPIDPAALERARSAGLVVVSETRVRPTLEGLAVADALAAELAPGSGEPEAQGAAP